MDRSFEILIHDQREMMLAYAHTLLGCFGTMYAEDVVQDACLSAYKNLNRFDESKGSVGAWLRAIVRNRAIDKLRQLSARTNVDIDSFAEGIEDVYAMFDRQSLTRSWGERVDILWECVGKLTKQMQSMVRMFYLSGYSLKEIGIKTSTSEMTVGQRLKRARDSIRLCAKRKLEGEFERA